jgi:circadian clock protein KaiB
VSVGQVLTVVLKLYICGDSPRSHRAIQRLEEICAGRDDCDARVIDVIQEPQAAEDARILATPVLVKEAPAPARRIVGDLTDLEAVTAWLELPKVEAKQ